MEEYTQEEILEALVDYLYNISPDELMRLWNIYVDESGYDEQVFNNDEEFFNTHFEGNADEAVRCTFYGDYRYPDKYVKFNNVANIDSFNNIYEAINVDDLSEFIEEYQGYFDIDIEDIVKNYFE